MWEPEDDDGIIESGIPVEGAEPTALIDKKFEEEIEGASEYSISVWSRWLTTYPEILQKK